MSIAEVLGALWWCAAVILSPALVWYLIRAAYITGRQDGQRAARRNNTTRKADAHSAAGASPATP